MNVEKGLKQNKRDYCRIQHQIRILYMEVFTDDIY